MELVKYRYFVSYVLPSVEGFGSIVLATSSKVTCEHDIQSLVDAVVNVLTMRGIECSHGVTILWYKLMGKIPKEEAMNRYG